MSDGSKEDLQSLYFELGNALASRSQLPQAADAYALAMYYARRSGNTALAEHCREQILVCQPGHVAAREASAPLFFAQLLMRYPAGYARNRLAQIQSEPSPATAGPLGWSVSLTPEASPAMAASSMDRLIGDEVASGSVMASAEAAPPVRPMPTSGAPINVPSYAAYEQPPRGIPTRSQAAGPPAPEPVRGPATVGTMDLPEFYPGGGRPADRGLASLFAPDGAVGPQGGALQRDWPGVGHSGLEQHHAFGAPMASMPSHRRVAEDFEMPSAPRRIERTPAPSSGMTWLNPIAALVAIAGTVAVGFFAFKLYPEVSKIDLGRARSMVDQTIRDGRALVEQFQSSPSMAPIAEVLALPLPVDAPRDVTSVAAPPESLAITTDAELVPSPPIPQAIPSVKETALVPSAPRVDRPNVTSPKPAAAAVSMSQSISPTALEVTVPAPGADLPSLAPAENPDNTPRSLPTIDVESSPLPAPEVEWSSDTEKDNH